MQVTQLKVTIKSLFLVLGVAGLVSCGSGDEAGGGGACGGADDTGLCLFVSSIVATDVDDGPDIDVIQVTCDPGPPPVIEAFVNARAIVTFGVSQVGPNPTGATRVFVTGYTLSYTPIAAPTLGTPIPTVVNTTFTVPIEVNGTTTGFADLLTIPQKAIPAGGVVFATYSAVYDFTAEDEFGNSMSVRASVIFDSGNFDNC